MTGPLHGALAPVVLALFAGLLAAAAFLDMRRRRIPDRLALALALASVPAALLAGLDGAALAWNLAAGDRKSGV